MTRPSIVFNMPQPGGRGICVKTYEETPRRLALTFLAGTLALVLAGGLSLLLSRFQVQAQPVTEVTAWTREKTVNATVAAPGDTLTYTIRIQNTGSDVDVWMTDTLPVELTWRPTDTLEAVGAGAENITVTNNTITWNEQGFGNFNMVIITFSAQISPDLTFAEIVNTAQITGTGGLVEFSSEKTTVIAEIGNLDNEYTNKTVSSQNAEPGDVLTYTISLSNDNSGSPVPGVQVVDNLPPSLRLVPGSITAIEGSYVTQTDVITWTVDMEAYWSGIDLVFEAEVLPYEGWVTNTADLTAPGHQPLTLAAPISVSQRHPYLEVSKSAHPDEARPSEYLTYTVHIVNTGDDVAETVWMTDDLPSEVTYQTGSASRGTFGEAGGVITWNATLEPTGTLALPPQGQAAITFTVMISPDLDRNVVFTNTAEVTGAGTLVQAQVPARATVTTIFYLPIIFKHWPPVPHAPTLHDINVPVQEADYTVSWSYNYGTPPVSDYTLQEATNASFTANLTEYDAGIYTSYNITGKANGTYYYRVRGQNSYGPGLWSNVESATVFVFSYSDDFSDYTSGWPRVWERTRGALYQVRPYEHPKCPGDDCQYTNGDGYVVVRRSSSKPRARFGPGVTVPTEDYEIEFDARWWDAQYHATYNIFFGSDSSFSNFYALDVFIDDPSVLPSHCSYRLYRRDGDGEHVLKDWSQKSVINCKVRKQDSDTPWNHWKIRRENNWITVSVNGTQLGSWYDATFGANRYFGVGCTLYEGLTPSKPEFDNWSVEMIR
jgi:uncharacterized repeat protein (TIGR01451 family)